MNKFPKINEKEPGRLVEMPFSKQVRRYGKLTAIVVGQMTRESLSTTVRWQVALMVLGSVLSFSILGTLGSGNAILWPELGAVGVLVILAGVLLRMAAVWERNHQNSKNWEAEKRPAYWVLGLTVLGTLWVAINYLNVNVTPKSDFPHRALCYTSSIYQAAFNQGELPKGFDCYAVLTHSWSLGWATLAMLVIVAVIAGISVWLFWFWSRDEVQKLRSDVERMNKGGPTNDELERKYREAAAEAERNRPRTIEEIRQQLNQDEFNRRGY